MEDHGATHQEESTLDLDVACEFFASFAKGQLAELLTAQLLMPRVSGAVDMFADSIGFLVGAHLTKSGLEVPGESTCNAWLEVVLGDKDLVNSMAKQVSDVLSATDEDASCTLSAVSVAHMGASCCTMLRLSGFEIDAKLVKHGSWPTDVALAAVAMYTSISQVFFGLSYIVNKLTTNQLHIDHEAAKDKLPTREFDPMLVAMVEAVGEECSRCQGLAHQFALEAAEVPKATIDHNDLLSTIAHMLSKVVPKLKRELLAASLKLMADDTATLEAKAPRYQHIITKQKYNGKLAKVQLLDNVVVTVLPGMINMHFELVASISKYVSEWSLGSASDLLEFQGAQAAIDLGNQVMAVIAAVNVVENFASDPRGPAMAEQLLEKKSDYPASLKDRLKAIANARG